MAACSLTFDGYLDLGKGDTLIAHKCRGCIVVPFDMKGCRTHEDLKELVHKFGKITIKAAKCFRV
jgi:hypothetical protein